MSGNYLLDTNVVIAILRNLPLFSPLPQDRDELSINVVVLGELRFGASKSQRPDEELRAVERFIHSVRVHSCGLDTAAQYAELRLMLANAGRPLPANDIWIAASALEHNLTLVTRDAHFDAIPHLAKERW